MRAGRHLRILWGGLALAVRTANADWALLDRFDDDALGTLDSQANTQGTWDTDGEGTVRVAVTTDGTNQVLTWRAQDAGNAREFAGPLGALSIPVASTAATLYLRFRHNGDGGYQRFGLWDQGGSDASLAGINTIDIQFILLDDVSGQTNTCRLVSREPSGGVTVAGPLGVGTWYSLWVVLNAAANTYDMYLQGGAYAAATRVRTNGVFRNAVTGALDGFCGQGFSNTTYTATSDLDDIYLDLAGANLTTPAAPVPPPPVDYDVYLIGGQSNADGRGYTNLLTGSLSAYAGTQADVRIFYANPANADPVNPSYRTGWTALRPGYAVAPGFSGALPSDRFGFELSLGRALADAHPDRHIALLKVTQGATSLADDWDPAGASNTLWRTFTNQVPAALAALAAGGNTCTVRGMIWHQGESDGSNPTFATDLAAFIDAARAFLGRPELPFAIGELERDDVTPTVTGRSYQLAAMAAVAAPDPYSGLVSSAGLPTIDGTHFDTASVIAFGQRYAAALADIDSDGLPDEWEAGWFGGITNSAGAAGDDQDGDGFSDRSEYGAGTDPTAAASLLRMGGLSGVSYAGPVITWSSVTGRTYQLQRSESFPSAWTTLQSVIPATPPLNTYTDAPPAAPSLIYRIGANPPL